MTSADNVRLPQVAAAKGVVVSRASWISRGTLGPECIILPVVAGRTVWAAAQCTDWLYLVEQPNYFGRFEHGLPQHVEAVTIRRWPGGAETGSVTHVAAGLEADHLGVARNLAGRLSQIPKVKMPHGKAESPWLVASLPIDPRRAAAALSDKGFANCHPMDRDYPEFPGGLQIEVAWSRERNEDFARTLETAIRP